MGRNYADAVCKEYGEVFQWLIGTPLICPTCRGKIDQKTKKRGNKNAK